MTSRFLQKNKVTAGFSLVEMLVYISILAMMLLLIINVTLSFTSQYRNLAALRAADNAGSDVMERMTRDIRAASSVLSGQSTFGTTTGVLTINASSNGNSTTTTFALSNGTVTVSLNGLYEGPLTASNVTVTGLVFTLLSGTTSSAVKIDFTLNGKSGAVTKTEKFHSTIVLKG